MRSLRALALLLLLPGACSAFWPFGDAQLYREARALYEQKKFAEVVARLSAADIGRLRRKDRPRAYEILGSSYERLGELQKALAVYQFAMGLYPRDINIVSNQANLVHGMELDDRARPLYERVLDIHPNNSMGHRGLAQILRKQGLHAEACDHFALALREHHKDPALWREYAEALADRRDFISAERAIERSLSLGDDWASFLDLADFQRAMRKAEAFASLDKARALAPDLKGVGLRRALWLLEDGRLEESLAQAEAVLASVEDEPLALWVRACVRIRRGEEERAREDLEKAAQAERSAPFVARVSRATLAGMARR